VTAPHRIRLSRAKGWRLPPDAVHVGRPSRWGNPYIVGKHGTRAQCAAKFYQLARGFIDLGGSDLTVEQQLTVYRRIRRHIQELAGKDLACWCALDGAACHADVLIMLANPDTPPPAWAAGGIDIGRTRLGMMASTLEKLQRDKKRRDREEAAAEPARQEAERSSAGG
jgi:hypothetical protein